MITVNEGKTPIVDFAELASRYKKAYEQTSHKLEMSEDSRKNFCSRINKALSSLSLLREDTFPGSVERAAVEKVISVLRNG